MRRSVWIFLASIFLPSLGLAWMAVRSAEDQQVVLEHQQVIISQNITDALAQNIQSQMDQVRADFVSTTQQLLDASPSPQALAGDFNGKLHDAWPLAEIGFAVNLDGEIYSPKPMDGADAQNFRTNNERFLSNRENAEIYSFNNAGGLTQNFKNVQSVFSSRNAPAAAADLTAGNVTAGELAPSQDNEDKHAAVEKIQQVAAELKIAAKQAPAQTTASPVEAPSGTATDSLQNLDATGLPNSQRNQDEMMPSTPAQNQAPVARAALKSSMAQTDQGTSSVSGGLASPDASSSGTDSAKDRNGFDVNASGNLAQAQAASAPSFSAPVSSTAPQAANGASFNLSPPPPPVAIGGSLALSGSSASAPNAMVQSSSSILNADLPAKILRQVMPQKMLSNDTVALSNTVPEASDFRQAIGSETSGSLARFLENKLRLMVWSHPAGTPIVFGAQLDQARLVEALKAAFQTPELEADGYSCLGHGEYCVAILDDTGHPVAQSAPDFKGDWKHPFVATEIGEALPHWEATLYLIDPQRTGRTARTLEATLGLIVLLLVAAIVSGGSLVAADVRRQMRLAQLKTDFVSNVSHELKTPLTSIRMFADLLAEKRVPDEQRQSAYLRIISAEAARLTRLINNVLDFARLERGAPPGEHRDCDLVDAVRDVVETCGPHLETAGIAFRSEIEADALPIRGDRDALAQIILNLVSNAEKYGGGDVLVRVRRQETPAGALGCVDVLDRGPGIPAEKVRTVFEPFQRLDDSLASGVPGSGLGLTLARRMARSHGGEVTYSARAGGGSCFTLTVPLRAG